MPAYGNPLLQQRPRRIDAGTLDWMLEPGTGPSTGRTGRSLAGGFKGLNNYTFLQDRSRPAFANPRIPYGMGRSAEEMAGIATGQGKIYRPDLGGFVPDTMYYRTMGSRGAGTVPNVQPQPPQMTDQQMEWARKAQAGKSGSDVLGKMGEKMAGFSNVPVAGAGPMGAIMSAAKAGISAAQGSRETPTFVSGGNPYANTRAQNFQNAVDAGEVHSTISDFNRQNAGTGYSMGGPNTMGRISYNPYANTLGREQLQGQIDAKRRAEMAAKGEAPVQFQRAAPNGAFADTESLRKYTQGPITSAVKVNPYGTATATFGERKGPGMVRDELTGKMVPISQAVADMKAVQATKGINPETGAALDEKEVEKQRKAYFDFAKELRKASGGKGGKSKVA